MPWSELKVTREFLSRKGGALDGRITQYKLNRRHCFETFRVAPLAVANGGGAAAGTTGALNRLNFGVNTFYQHIKGSGQTIIVPVITASGLNISLDQTNDEGMELVAALTAADGAFGVFKVGTDDSFFCRAKIKVEDISGTDDLCVGFRKVEASQANVDDYDEAAWLGVGQGAAGRFNTETILNNGATVTTNLGLTAWADGETHELEVRVGFDRAVAYRVDGRAPTAAPAFNFDAGEYVTPFIYFLHSADVAGAVEVAEWEFGHVLNINPAA